MTEKQKNFKPPPKKYQARGLPVIYEDRDILVVNKINGLLTVGTDRIKEETAYYRLSKYVKKGNPRSKNRVFIVHRLDRDTSGVIVFAKSVDAKRYLQDEWRHFTKKYYAVVHGILDKKEDVMISYLTENSAFKVYSVKDSKKGKLSKTGYRVLGESERHSLLEVDLITGRKNQIRVHFSEKGHPVVGDKLYGTTRKGVKRLMLHSASLTLSHPYSKEEMTFETKVPAQFSALFHR